MEVLAVSTALPSWHNINGKPTLTSIVRTPLSSGTIETTFNGIKNNDTAVHEGPIYAFFAHHYDYWRAQLAIPPSTWSWCHWGENLTLKFDSKHQLNESDIRLGDIWQVGATRLQVSGARIPCFKLAWRCGQPDKWLARLAESGFCGVYFSVLTPGPIRVGDRGKIVERRAEGFDCASITRVAFAEGSLRTRDTMSLLADEPALLKMLRMLFRRKVTILDDRARENKHAWSGWRRFRPCKIVDEGGGVVSFYLKPVDGEPLAPFRPGQFLTVRLPTGDVRSWSLSDWPSDADEPGYYRLSIKRAQKASVWMATWCGVSTVLEARAPAGRFVLDWEPMFMPRQVYLSAGIGITPVFAMMKAHAAHPSMGSTDAVWIHVARNSTDIPLREELAQLPANLKRRWCFTCPQEDEVLGRDFEVHGRPTKPLLEALLTPTYNLRLGTKSLALDGHMSSFYICGPTAFETSMRAILTELGVAAPLIHSEAFTSSGSTPLPDLEEAFVRFTKSKVDAVWRKAEPKSILELAEEAGLTPDYGCRTGSCGSCAVNLGCGSAAGGLELDGRVRICSARPDSSVVEVEI